MTDCVQGSRDPERRREKILAAAEAVIAESGTERATHRRIAERAGVALGSTTYYFPTRRDLVAAALERATRVLREECKRWTDVLRDADDVPAVLTELVHEYLQDRTRTTVETELYLGAGRDPGLAALAQQWLDGFAAVLEPHTDSATAAAVMAFIDGMTLQSVVTGSPPGRAPLAFGIERLMSAGTDR